MDDFERAQEIIDGRVRPLAKPKRLFFTYRGLIRYGKCNAAVTAKNTTNPQGRRYVHYFCCRKAKHHNYCAEGAVQEYQIEEQLRSFFEHLLPPPTWVKALLAYLKQLQEDDEFESQKATERLNSHLQEIDRRLERERELLVDGVIEEDEYKKDRDRLRVGAKPPDLMELHSEAVAWLNQAEKLFENGTPDERRQLVEAAIWNLKLEGGKLLIQAKKPYSQLGSWATFPVKSG